MANIGRSLMWAMAGGLTRRVVRGATRRAMHTPYGATRLPPAARKGRGFGNAMMWAAGAGAMLALADVLQEQRKDTLRKENALHP